MYTYCLNNPINNYDPSGFIIETVFDIASLGWSVIELNKNPSWSNSGFVIWDAAAAFMPIVPGSYTVKGTKLVFKVSNRLSDLQKGAGLTLDTYLKLKKLYRGKAGIEIHHLIEKRFRKQLGISEGKILSIPLDKKLHQEITNRWRREIAYGKNPTPKEVLKAADRVYKDMPKLKNEIKKWLRRNGIK